MSNVVKIQKSLRNQNQELPLLVRFRLVREPLVQQSTFHKGRTVIKTSIVDTGIGIATEHAEKIFDPFFTTKATSAGLGLTISHQIISRHGGVLYRNSARKNGTEFIFELPLMGRA